MSLKLKQVNTTLEKWFSDAIGRPVVRRNSRAPKQQKTYGTYQIKSIKAVNVDEARPSEVDAGGGNVDIEYLLRGDRTFIVEFRVVSRTQDDDCYAMQLLEQAQLRLRAPWAKALFQEGCIAIVEQVMDVMDVSRGYQQRVENVAVMEVRFAKASVESDTRSTVGTIESICISSDMQPMGDPLQLDDDCWVPPPPITENDNNIVAGGNNVVAGGNNVTGGAPG